LEENRKKNKIISKKEENKLPLEEDNLIAFYASSKSKMKSMEGIEQVVYVGNRKGNKRGYRKLNNVKGNLVRKSGKRKRDLLASFFYQLNAFHNHIYFFFHS
jgi:hypothetical protein